MEPRWRQSEVVPEICTGCESAPDLIVCRGDQNGRIAVSDGVTLPPRIAAEISRLRRRLGVVLDLIGESDAERDQVLATRPDDPVTPNRLLKKSLAFGNEA